MDIQHIPLFSLLSNRMSWLSARQSVLAENVSNADTPNYIARDLRPLDFAGIFDERSDRMHALGELTDRGYEDAYRQFIEPVVAAGGERIAPVRAAIGRPEGTRTMGM